MGYINDTDYNYYEGGNLGGYQFVSIDDIVSQFMVAYVGEEKLISKVNRDGTGSTIECPIPSNKFHILGLLPVAITSLLHVNWSLMVWIKKPSSTNSNDFTAWL